MPSPPASPRPVHLWGLARIIVGALTIGILLHAWALRVSAGDGNPFDYFGYFTNQTSLIASVVLIAAGVTNLRGLRPSDGLILLRAVTTTCLLVVGLIYNVLVPGTGSAPPWVSAALHVALPVLVLADWIFAPDRRPLAWRMLWITLPYSLVWLTVVLLRGATDGWVPYGFLLPERGAVSLWSHVAGLLGALLAAAAVVWALSRVRTVVYASGGRNGPDRPEGR
ncbi:Pr6Pr family membrane protein [Microbacterium sp. CIAB417]|uniref:Pr6Pr family membrane protein n=1 Tax=Microbacterium sp. CIAB417 TaxID=2860287 RepID=UPI001FAC970B|nr:Pr6Pr family membrane protein [Microbacterium sp. CIAB417]